MNIALDKQVLEPKHRLPSFGSEPEVLADIYQQEVNIAIWQRTLSDELNTAISHFLSAKPKFEEALTLAPDNAYAAFSEACSGSAPNALLEDVAELVDMFCCLFELKRAGLRLATLNQAMCPRFHVDRVPCRLVTTYSGVTTEWLPHQSVDRSKLGAGSNGKADSASGLYQQADDIKQLGRGDIALLKGELWAGNENAGLVHRSPAVPAEESRLLLTLDFSD